MSKQLLLGAAKSAFERYTGLKMPADVAEAKQLAVSVVLQFALVAVGGEWRQLSGQVCVF